MQEAISARRRGDECRASGGSLAVGGIRALALTGLLLLGLWVSLCYCFAAWQIDPDIANPVMLWRGIREHGLPFLETWRPTESNWFLSVMPIYFAAFSAFGTSPLLVLLIGWLMWVLVALATVAVLCTAGDMPAALWVGLLVLFPNFATAGAAGFVTYPVTHNASMLWGLAGLLCAARWQRSGGFAWLAAGGACLFVASMSDPWTQAAFEVPILGAALAATWPPVERIPRDRLLCLAGAVVVVHILVITKLFGVLHFLIPSTFSLATLPEFLDNMRWLSRLSAAMGNIIPLMDLPDNGEPPIWAAIIDWTALVSLLLFCGVQAMRHWRSMPIARRLIVGTAFCSVMVMVAAFLLGNRLKNPTSGRYLMNALVFLPMLCVLVPLPVGRRGNLVRGLLVLYAGLYLTSGLSSRSSAWTQPRTDAYLAYTTDWVAFLRGHDLHFGYSSFWAAHSEAVNWLADDIQVLPVRFDAATDRFMPRLLQSSPFWFRHEAVPAAATRFFLVLAPDSELCSDVAACARAAERQFGPPQETLRHNDALVLVWPYPMLTAAPPVSVAMSRPRLQQHVRLSLRDLGNARAICGAGWAKPMAGTGFAAPQSNGGAWSTEPLAYLLLHLPSDWQGPATVRFSAIGFAAPLLDRQPVDLFVDGEQVGHWEVSVRGEAAYEVTIPARLWHDDAAVLTLHIPHAIAPLLISNSTDNRDLGIRLESLSLQ